MKLKWRTAEAPTGRYASFQHRSWPTAENGAGKILARIDCWIDGKPVNTFNPGDRLITSYSSHLAKADPLPDNKQLKVYLADYSANDGRFVWRGLKTLHNSLKEAKAAAQKALDQHPEFLPK